MNRKIQKSGDFYLAAKLGKFTSVLTWPDMDILDLRNLAFDCAQNMDAEGMENTEHTFTYSNSRSFTTTTNSTWGHGILSLTCLFTPNGGLQDPTTGQAVSGGFYGPLSGSAALAEITAADYTGRGFSAHLQAGHWQTLAASGRSLWEDASLRESRVSAAVLKRFGKHEIALQGVWRSGLSGALEVNGRRWALSPRREAGAWLTWRLSR